jgi:signal transduction histidine kinase/HPt (histidine-containing phosphotransfer) domain-containing protein
MNMPEVLEKFLTEMGFALLEYTGNGAFLPLAKLPPWFHELWGESDSITIPLALADKSPFLENFLLEAETFWVGTNSAGCRSEPWVERSSSGRDIPLQARALHLGGKRILAVSSPDPEFRERAKILQTARNALLDHERLAREIQKKEILLHCIVHDLSQPLSVMHVAIDCLAEEPISQHSKQFLTLGKLASNQQETMIREILHTFSADLRASLDAGTEGTASADLLECARKSMTVLLPTFETKGVRLRLDAGVELAKPWPVRAEESRLQRIFSNLLENALRYTPSGASVTVGVEDEGAFLKAYVDDEGPGLPNDLRPEQIFGLFMKGKHSGGKAGLGLYFCRITVERWGGNIGCVTLPAKGSRFWFRIPRAAGTTAPSATDVKSTAISPENQSLHTHPLRILFADDQKDIRTVTTYQLKRKGHKVVAVRNGKDALKAFRKGKFDVILLDQEMPGLTGDQVAQAIRKIEAGKKKSHTFLVAATGNTSAEDIRRLKAVGFDNVLSKPFRLEDLHAILHAAPPAPTASLSNTSSTPASKVDFSFLLTRVGGDEKLLARMIQTFLHDTPKRLGAIASALRRQNVEDLASLAHALKGSVSIFGAEAARLKAQDLQEIARSGDLESAETLMGSLKEEIANLLANLRGYAHQIPARPTSHRAKRQRPPRKRGKPRR